MHVPSLPAIIACLGGPQWPLKVVYCAVYLVPHATLLSFIFNHFVSNFNFSLSYICLEFRLLDVISATRKKYIMP